MTRLYINDIKIFSCDQRKTHLICNALLTTIYKSGVCQGSKIVNFEKKVNSPREALQQSRCRVSKTSFSLQPSYGKKYNIANTIVLNLYLAAGSILELKKDYSGALASSAVFQFYCWVK